MECDGYLEQLNALLPPGRIWPREPDSRFQLLLLALAERLCAVEVRAGDLLVELYPPTTVEIIDEWEAMLGLPDECAPPAQTLQERRLRVIERLTVRPNPTAEYLVAVCQTLGYASVTITETGPFEFTVEVPTPSVTYFRTGESRCGDLLGEINRATDLECILTENKPAHLTIVFNYSGV